MGRNLLRKTETMILVVATVLLRLVPDGGMEAVLIVILTVEIIDMPSSHGGHHMVFSRKDNIEKRENDDKINCLIHVS